MKVLCCIERGGQAPARIPRLRAAGLARVPHHPHGLAAPRPAVHHQRAAAQGTEPHTYTIGT